jgi:hypothetical protein
MRDDLLDAQAAIDWAVAQIPVLQDRFLKWQQGRPYEIVMEPDPKTGEQLVTARYNRIDPLISVEIGTIVNAIRSSLDILAATLAQRNGVKPTSKMHFPIHTLASDFLDPAKGIDSKKWLSQWERATIKSLRPYKGGDAIIWTLHQLDIVRKHERLAAVTPNIESFFMSMHIPHGEADGGRMNDKTILRRFPSNTSTFLFTENNSHLTGEITLNEPALGLSNAPAIPTLRQYAQRCADIIKLFDVP